jgi:uncharacterized membrane protein
MSIRTAHIISAILILLSVVGGAIAYPGLPDQIATHWNAAGQPDDYSSKLVGVLIGPAMGIGIWLIMWLIPIVSPKGFRTDRFMDTVAIFQVTMIAFMCAIGGIVILAGFGYEFSMDKVIGVGVGLLFVVLGNYLGKLRKNFFIGIRTPWTLASDEVWDRTHRIGGYLMMLAGIVMAAGALFGSPLVVMIGAPVAFAVISVGYSFVAYKRIEGFTEDADA